MSLTISLEEAQATLSDLLSTLGPGEEVVITKDDHPVAALRSCAAGKPPPRFGNCQGMLTIVTEDDEHLKDFQEYMP